MKKIECILLVDDSSSTNFYHKKLIEISGQADSIYEAENGLEALDYMNKKGKFTTSHPRPSIIFLDINMPKMDGFEFLENYTKLPDAKKADIIIVFLTTSNWTKDKVKAIESKLVYDFIEKPLTKETLQRICTYYRETYL